MLENTEPVENAGAPFCSVDTVSTEIFGKLIDSVDPENLPSKQTTVVKNRLQRVAEFLLDAEPKLGSTISPQLNEMQPPFDFAVVVEGLDQDSYFAFVRERTDRHKDGAKGWQKALSHHWADRVSYRSSGRLSNLPQGIQLIENKGERYSEDKIMSAIKGVMIQQKRETNLRNLPELEPATPSKDASTFNTGEAETMTPTSISQKLRSGSVHMFRQDKVLAIGLSVWIALLIMMLIDQGFLSVLFAISFFLLIALFVAIRNAETV